MCCCKLSLLERVPGWLGSCPTRHHPSAPAVAWTRSHVRNPSCLLLPPPQEIHPIPCLKSLRVCFVAMLIVPTLRFLARLTLYICLKNSHMTCRCQRTLELNVTRNGKWGSGVSVGSNALTFSEVQLNVVFHVWRLKLRRSDTLMHPECTDRAKTIGR